MLSQIFRGLSPQILSAIKKHAALITCAGKQRQSGREYYNIRSLLAIMRNSHIYNFVTSNTSGVVPIAFNLQTKEFSYTFSLKNHFSLVILIQLCGRSKLKSNSINFRHESSIIVNSLFRGSATSSKGFLFFGPFLFS